MIFKNHLRKIALCSISSYHVEFTGIKVNSCVSSFKQMNLAHSRLFSSTSENTRGSADEVCWHRKCTLVGSALPHPFFGCEWSVPEMMYSVKNRAGGII